MHTLHTPCLPLEPVKHAIITSYSPEDIPSSNDLMAKFFAHFYTVSWSQSSGFIGFKCSDLTTLETLRTNRSCAAADAAMPGIAEGDFGRNGAAAPPLAPPPGCSRRLARRRAGAPPTAEFYKAWDRYGALSNFSPHAVRLPAADGALREWPTVEHYYQAQKFMGVDDPAAAAVVEASPLEGNLGWILYLLD